MELIEIKKRKQPGDFITAGKIVGISQGNVTTALNRPGSKYHEPVVRVMEAIINNREHFILEMA